MDQEQVEFFKDGNKIKSVLVSNKHEADRRLMENQIKEETNKKGRGSRQNDEDEAKDEEKKLMKVTSSDLEIMRQQQSELEYA